MDHHLPSRREGYVERINLGGRDPYPKLKEKSAFRTLLESNKGELLPITQAEINSFSYVMPKNAELHHLNTGHYNNHRWLESIAEEFLIPTPNLYFFYSDTIWARFCQDSCSVVLSVPPDMRYNEALSFNLIAHEFAHGLREKRPPAEIIKNYTNEQILHFIEVCKSDERFCDAFARAVTFEGFTKPDPNEAIALLAHLEIKKLPLDGNERSEAMEAFFKMDRYSHPTFEDRAKDALTGVTPEWQKFLDKAKAQGKYSSALVEYAECMAYPKEFNRVKPSDDLNFGSQIFGNPFNPQPSAQR